MSVNIPDSVTGIAIYTFSDCTSLKSVVIGNGVTSIGSGAFENCSSLTSIVIPRSVTSIGNRAFIGCTALDTVYYTGSIDQWYEIDGLNSTTYGNSNLTSANRIYNYNG